MIKTRADFDYNIANINGEISVFIIDRDSGGMSVTNDIENVVASIEEKEGIDTKDCMVMYRDSSGIWDGWDGSDFVQLGCSNELEASKEYRRIKNGDTLYGIKTIEGAKCPECGYELNAAAYANGGKAIPKKGDFSICARCYAINVFDEGADGQLSVVRKATEQELAEFEKEEPDTCNRMKQLKESIKFRYNIDLKYFKGEIYLSFLKCSNGGTAIRLIDFATREPVAVATVNIPDEKLEDGQVIIKNWSQNEGILEWLQKNFIVGDSVRTVATGWVKADVVFLNKKITDYLNSLK